MDNREVNMNPHPPTCTCVVCVNNRLRKGGKMQSKPIKQKTNDGRRHTVNRLMSNWLWALLLIFVLSIVGLGINFLIGSFIPFYLLLGFSCIYSIEKWFGYTTKKYKGIGIVYRLFLNLCILSLLGLIVWSGFKLFSQQLTQSATIGSFVFLAEFTFFIWIWRVLSRNSWRYPSMKLTIFSLLAITTVFTFAGTQPMASYKDEYIGRATTFFEEQKGKAEAKLEQTEKEQDEQQKDEERKGIEEKAAEYARRMSEAIIASELAGLSYDNVVLRNPSLEELKGFLWNDQTDKLSYVFPTFVCHDFALTLQDNAKKEGWRCALLSVQLSGYPDFYNYGIPSNTGHALNAFETTDRGLVYIDCTSTHRFSGNADKIIDVKIGKEYMAKSIFPTSGWGEWLSMGKVVSIGNLNW